MTSTIIERAAARLAAEIQAGGIAPAAREINTAEVPALLAAVCLRLLPYQQDALLREIAATPSGLLHSANFCK